MAAAKAYQVHGNVDRLKLFLHVDLQSATQRPAKLVSCVHVVELDHHATIGKDF